MFISNGIAYAGTRTEEMQVRSVKPLLDHNIFKAAQVEYGVVTWMDGDIDIAPETMYEKSYAYEDMRA